MATAKGQKIAEYAESKLGCAYIWGGYGEKLCTPSFRKERAEAYPSQKNNIYRYCPVLSGQKSLCTSCKYSGKQAYDCAQLTRYACKAGGQELVSGANSQWKSGVWEKKGTIDSFPDVPGVILYHANDAGTMTHTGVAVGGGMAVEARSAAYGVVKTAVKTRSWTHWAALPGVLSEEAGNFSSTTETVQESTSKSENGTTGNVVVTMNTLRSGSKGTVKTVDGETPYVEGDVHINAVRYTAQTMTEAQKTQARTNIAALGPGDVVNNLASTETSKPLSAAQGKALKELIDNQTGGDPTVVEITATTLAAKSTTERAALYTDGARLLKVTNGDTVVILALASDGSTQFEASNKPLNNLLDNSNFAQPVNQRGNSTYNTSGYTIDRWRTWDEGTISLSDGYLSVGTNLYQYIDADMDTSKEYTIAAKDSDNNVEINSGSLDNSIWGNKWIHLIVTDENIYFRIYPSDQTKNVVWVALYEGAYTLDTLPPYTPKGYDNELLTSMRYYQTLLVLLGEVANSSRRQIINFRVPMRKIPTITYNKYAGDDFAIVTCNQTNGVDLKTTTNYTHALIMASADL